jgi:hypothetical protein
MTADVATTSMPITRPRRSVLGSGGDAFLTRIAATVDGVVVVGGRAEVERAFTNLTTTSVGTTLDLIGHSTMPQALLQLGDWVIDARDPGVMGVFAGLAALVPELAIDGVRLLGCNTATTAEGRETIVALAECLGIEVFGVAGPISPEHFDARGFDPGWRFLLRRSSELGATLPRHEVVRPVPASPRRFASADEARRILALVRETEGAPIARPAHPTCELVLPGASGVRVLGVVHGDTFLQQAEDHGRALAFPVSDPAALRSIIDAIQHRESLG